MLRRFIALPLAALAALMLASTALAGGWAQVTVPNIPTDPPAGSETTIELNVLQHGVTAVSWPRITVIATDATSGDTIAAQAKASGPDGHYTAKLTFPSAGDWTLSFVSPELVMEGEVALSVVAAFVPPAPAARAATSGFDVLPLALLLMVALFAAIAIAAVTMRSREGARATRVTART